MGEDFRLVDPDGDGVFLILFGANSVSAGVDHLAHVWNGRLAVVHATAGRRHPARA